MRARIVSLAALTFASCGQGDTCFQVGPPQGFALRPLDMFVAASYPEGQPLDTFITDYGSEYAGVAPDHYPQTCVSQRPEDMQKHRFVGWVDGWAYTDGGVPPWQTYCADLRDAGCGPQPGQLHGEVLTDIRSGENNIILIPLSP